MKQVMSLLAVIALLPLFAAAQFVNNGATITVTSGGSIVLNNIAFQNNGTFIQTAGTVAFTGNANTTISGTNVPTFYLMTVDKPGATLQLQTGITVKNTLQFTSGLLDLNTNNITLDPAAQINGETETGRITGTSGGYVQIIQPLNAPSAVNPGNLGAVITSTQNLGNVTIRRGHQSQVNPFGNGNSILRYYDIIPDNNTALNANVRINYLDAELNGLTESNLTLWKSANTTNWTELGFTARDATANFLHLSGINDLGRFTLSSPANPLPLIWNSFSTQCTGSQVRIGWKTEQEQNTASFIIRRSADGRNWATIATLPAAGNSNTPRNYTYTDPLPLAGKGYYQVQQQDLNGRLAYSPVLRNQCGIGDGLNVYPNPAVSQCWVSIQSMTGSAIIMRLYDSKGALVQQRRETVIAGNNQFELSLHSLAQGVYSLVVTYSDGRMYSTQLNKQ